MIRVDLRGNWNLADIVNGNCVSKHVAIISVILQSSNDCNLRYLPRGTLVARVQFSSVHFNDTYGFATYQYQGILLIN